MIFHELLLQLNLVGAGFLLVFIITLLILIIMLIIMYNVLIEIRKVREILEKVE